MENLKIVLFLTLMLIINPQGLAVNIERGFGETQEGVEVDNLPQRSGLQSDAGDDYRSLMEYLLKKVSFLF